MVPELRENNRRGNTVQVDCVVYIQEIKPWPPSHSLRSLDSVYLQWRSFGRTSGSTRSVIPSIGSGVGDGKIRFNESFKLSGCLFKDTDSVQKNYLEFNLYGSQRDKTVEDQLLGAVIVDLLKHENLKKTVTISALMNFKRSLRATSQPVLLIKIQPINKHAAHSSSTYSMPKGDRATSHSVNGEYLDASEISSFNNGNVCSSPAFFSPGDATEDLPHEESASEGVMSSTGKDYEIKALPREPDNDRTQMNQTATACRPVNESSSISSSKDISHELVTSQKNKISFSMNNHIKETSPIRNTEPPSLQFSPTSIGSEDTEADVLTNKGKRDMDRADLVRQVHEKIVKSRNKYRENGQQLLKDEITTCLPHIQDRRSSDTEGGLRADGNRQDRQRRKENHSLQGNGVIHEVANRERVEPVEPLPNPTSSVNGSIREIPTMEDIKEIDVMENFCPSTKSFSACEKKNVLDVCRGDKNSLDDGKVQQLECRIERLETELRETAIVEISLYKIVPEHGSSTNKFYAPARRLSGLYFSACKIGSAVRKASAARSALSGIVLVTRASANDIPRLAFWLSNIVALRISISGVGGKMRANASEKSANERISSSKKVLSSRFKRKNFDFPDNIDHWDDPDSFTTALEKIEAWIFTQIIESLWKQTFTPYIHKISKEEQRYQGSPMLGDQAQINFSLELWKKAFTNSHRKLCPVRGEGNECACLSSLARLVMKHCIDRLDLALFNAVLCESAEKVITDPVSDPINHSNILPISAGKSSFGAGAQLKNVIGNWSRWLSDLFGILNNETEADENKPEKEQSFKFQLLNALSDLMMLPKDMLLNNSIRKEVCPAFSAHVIKRVLNNFVPDEFCPDQIPEAVFEALDSEDPKDDKVCIPWNIAGIVYLPPSPASLASIQTSLLWKSDDIDAELDEVDSALNSLLSDKPCIPSPVQKPKGNGGGNPVRYQLLREEWRCEV